MQVLHLLLWKIGQMVTPVNSTYVTKILPCVTPLDSRGFDTTKDGYMENFIPSVLGKEVSLTKRDAIAALYDIAGATGFTKGFFYWQDQDKFLIAIGRNVYVISRSSLTVLATFVNAVNANITSVGFCQYLTSTGIQSVIFTDGTTLSQVSTTNVLTVCADADLPTPHLAIPVYFDGYLLLVKANTADCYNSDLDTPLSWTPGNFITAEKSPDIVTGITTINDFFVLLGSNSIEYFYNQGNPTGTPFQRSDTFIKLTGYYGGLAKYGNTVYIVGESDEGGLDIFHLENYKLTPIGGRAVKQFLTTKQAAIGWLGGIVTLNGTSLYIIRAGDVSNSSQGDTYYFDMTSGLWGKLSVNGVPLNFVSTQSSTHYPLSCYFILNNVASIMGFLVPGQSNYADGLTLSQSSGDRKSVV